MSNDVDEDVGSVFVTQCNLKSNDIDHKITALTNLHAQLENNATIQNWDSVINVLKSCLRTSNTHLYTPALVSILSSLKTIERCTPRPDTMLLRLLVTSFLPSGGVIDRLGETREKSREKAREIIVILGRLCCVSSGGIQPPTSRSGQKAHETPLMQFERLLREVGFSSKIWRVREQSILVFVQIRRTTPTFPLRPFLPSFVSTLQDSDGTVRDCARKNIITIFSSVGIAEAAKADLKREMEKQGVRRTVVEEILSGVIGSGQSSEIPEAKVPLPPSTLSMTGDIKSLGSRAGTPDISVPTTPLPRNDAEIPAVYIASARDLEQEFFRMLNCFQGKETEHNWQDRDRSIMRLRGMLVGEIHRRYEEAFLSGLKHGILDGTFKPLLSLRTTLSSQTCSFYSELAMTCKTSIDPFVESLLINLLRMSGYTKKIIATQSQSSVTTIIKNTSCQPRVTVPMICSLLQEKTATSRAFAVDHIKTLLDAHAAKSRSAIESSGGLETLEKSIHKALSDASPLVREPARLCFWSFYSVWPDRASAIMEKLDLTARKQLQKVSPTDLPSNGISATPEPKKSSVAAAIAASRAKAKQIAAAPPSLRHQATSSSHFSHTSSQASTMNRIVSAPNTSPRSIRTASSGENITPVIITVKKGRTPSTATLPASSDGSARNTPSPTFSQGSRTGENTRMPSPRQSKSSRGSRAQISSRTPMTPSKFRDVTSRSTRSAFDARSNSERPSSPPFSVSSGNDDRLDESFSLMSFPSPTADIGLKNSRALSSSLSLGEPEPAIEEELRATSAQAVAAAEQLLDLTLSVHQSNRPQVQDVHSILTSNGSSAYHSASGSIQTPSRRGSGSKFIWDEVKAFENSPMPNGPPKRISSSGQSWIQNNWWLKTKTLIEKGVSTGTSACQLDDLPRVIGLMSQNQASKEDLWMIFLFCRRSSSVPGSDLPENPIYSGMNDLLRTILPYIIRNQTIDNLQISLLILWEIAEHWKPVMNGNELELYQSLLAIRGTSDAVVLEGSNALRDLLSASTDAVYGLTTLHACLNESLRRFEKPTEQGAISTYVFGLNGINRFILRLPAQVLEEELPRIRPLILKSLAHENTVVRSAASMVVVSAQMVLNDQAHLFALLDGLSDEKKNFLTYLFDKNQIQQSTSGRQMGMGIVDERNPAFRKMELEVVRLDGRVNPR